MTKHPYLTQTTYLFRPATVRTHPNSLDRPRALAVRCHVATSSRHRSKLHRAEKQLLFSTPCRRARRSCSRCVQSAPLGARFLLEPPDERRRFIAARQPPAIMFSRKKKSQQPANKKSLIYKVIILGDSGVGKTSLMNQYVCPSYSSSQRSPF